MPVTISTHSNSLLDQLSGHIESLQARFRKLSKTATLNDVGIHFAAVLSEKFPDAVIDLVHCPVGDHRWEKIIGTGTWNVEQLLPPPGGTTPEVCEINGTPPRMVIVQRLFDQSMIGLLLHGRHSTSMYSEFDLLSLKLFVLLFDNAFKDVLYRRTEKELIFSLNHRILQLNSLIDTGIEVASLESDAQPHQLALARAASLTNASKGVVRVTRGKKLKEKYTFPDGIKLLNSRGESQRIAAKFVFLEDTYTFELFEKESRSGLLPFEETDQLLLDALARQVCASLENRYLLQQTLEKQRIEQEINVAASIQKKIIPVSLPQVDGYDIAGTNIPSKSVGGDYYDCIPLQGGRYALVIADVTGKGVAAALLVSSLHAYLSAYLELSGTLSQLAEKLNKALYNASTDDKFVTAFIALLAPQTGQIEYLSAGHNPGYVLRNDRIVEELKVGGPPLGAFDMEIPYESDRTMLARGDRLLLYTDGVTEAMNEQHELYDQEFPLVEFFARNKPVRSEIFVEDLLADIRKFSGSAPQSDDITLLYLRRLP